MMMMMMMNAAMIAVLSNATQKVKRRESVYECVVVENSVKMLRIKFKSEENMNLMMLHRASS